MTLQTKSREACKRLDYPIYFRYAQTLTLENIVDVQVNAG